MRASLLIMFATLLFALPAAAQEARSEAAATAAKEKKVRTLLELSGASSQGRQVMDAMLAQFEQMPELPKGFITEFKRVAKPADLVELIVPIYSKHLTEGDVDALIAFYKSPAGQRFVAAQPEITSESMEAGRRWGEGVARQVIQTLELE